MCVGQYFECGLVIKLIVCALSYFLSSNSVLIIWNIISGKKGKEV